MIRKPSENEVLVSPGVSSITGAQFWGLVLLFHFFTKKYKPASN
jgi:hypothetical protein